MLSNRLQIAIIYWSNLASAYNIKKELEEKKTLTHHHSQIQCDKAVNKTRKPLSFFFGIHTKHKPLQLIRQSISPTTARRRPPPYTGDGVFTSESSTSRYPSSDLLPFNSPWNHRFQVCLQMSQRYSLFSGVPPPYLHPTTTSLPPCPPTISPYPYSYTQQFIFSLCTSCVRHHA